jgi:hypothetical protein
LFIGLENAWLEYVLLVEETFGEHPDGNQAKPCVAFFKYGFDDPRRTGLRCDVWQHPSDVSEQSVVRKLLE